MSLQTDDDQRLIRRMAEGDAAAIGLFYDRYGQLIFSVALRITGDRGSAEEVTQDVFLRLWQHAARYRTERGSLVTWLLTITQRRAIDELRSRRGAIRRREVELSETLPVSPEPDLAALLHLRTDLQQALAELPSAQREAIELLFFRGLSRQEIADQTASPLATIHTRLRLGMEKLRAIFLQHEQDSESATG
ncbi:MAG: sigma-70 family RNA polymerase sigma factor [Chloroflexi bacterium]|nr:sigma-70 family RNA polymerase sigma factor [Chloroflexota bacterium]